MKKFEIEIEEILQRVVTEEAETLEDALDNVYDKYKSQEIVLDDSDFKGEEIRAFGSSKEVELRKDCPFDINIGQAILLEGNQDWGIIKILRNNDKSDNYIVVEGLSYIPEKDYFNWNQGKHCNNILEAILYYDARNHNIENSYLKSEGEIPNYRKVELFEPLIDEMFVGRNVSEVIQILHEKYELSNEEIKIITSCDNIEDYIEDNEEEKE